MPREKKSLQKLHVVDYDIGGNAFRAWKNDADELIFVLDETIDDFKPNVLLVINAQDDRKWDDILVNDYGMNLEDVRPKVDNKYQKLDIEYTGLDVYAQLIYDYEHGADLSAIIADLIDFRDTAARRAAMARLTTANEIISVAEDTIMRAERAKAGLRDRRRNLRNRLANQKENIGREPTKQSASKILKTESQIDAVGEKLARADRRIENAKRRIEIATEDANAARDLLSRRRTVDVVVTDTVHEQVLVPAKNDTPSAKLKITNTLEDQTEEVEVKEKSEKIKETKKMEKIEKDDVSYFPVPNYEYKSQPRDEEMSDSEEVKPLLDQDPEILDDEIAFKPVAFDDIKPRVDEQESALKSKEYVEPERTETSREVVSETVARPLAFSNADNVSQEVSYTEETTTEEITDETPVIDTIKTVQEPSVSDTDTTGRVTNTQYANSEPIRPATPVAPVVNNNYVRPISPITGNNGTVRPVGTEQNRTNFAYYLLLILLIALSIFTLWLYQKKNGGTVPFLNASTQGTIEQTDENAIDNNMVGFEETTPEKTTLPEPFVQPEPIIEPEPVVVEPEPEPMIINEPIKIEYPNENILRAAQPDVPVVEPEEDVLARKVAYDVAREDKPIYTPEPRVTNVVSPDVIFEDDIISVPVVPADYADEGVYYQDDSAYYENQGEYYDESAAYQEYNQTGGFVVNEQPREPQTTRHLDVYDGGQYSIGYTETTY